MKNKPKLPTVLTKLQTKLPAVKRTTIQLGNIPITTGTEAIRRIALLLWGEAGCGKTTFAATAPGKKLWLSLGDNEHVPVAHRDDVMVADLSGHSYTQLFNGAMGGNPFGLAKLLEENEDITTVVFDNITGLAHKALEKAVGDGVGRGANFTPSIVAPGLSAYGGRTNIVLDVMSGLLRVTSEYGVHFIATAHEADPSTAKVDGKEVIDKISVMLGGGITNNMSWRFSEIWYMSFSTSFDQHRRLMIRPSRRRRPVKTRMFTARGEPEFRLDYDNEIPDEAKGQMTIAGWWEDYHANGGRQIPVPVSKAIKKGV